LFLVVTGGVAAWLLATRADPEPVAVESESEIVQEPEPEPVATGAEMKLLLGGNIFWGRRTNTTARASTLGVVYPFSGLSALEREKYDAWIAGLECPVTNNGHNKYEEDSLLKFNCDPDYLSEAAKWFTVVSLGNNHTDNQGAAGFQEMKEHLTAAGIQYFGHYDYRNTTEVCAPIKLPLRVSLDDGSVRDGETEMAFCGFHGVFGIPTEAALGQVREWASKMPVIAMPHMGVEYKPANDQLRQNIYRKIIDYGAEMVIGDHPHWVQNTEAYKGKLVVYSTGNFMFDQTFSAEVKRGVAIEATAKFDANLQLLGWEYAYHAVTNNGKDVTVLGDAALQKAVGNRLGWS
jgi:poly-gamma-glutamate synthesis protein (capsule biosynthesis protein)